jgi:hypothetical protein
MRIPGDYLRSESRGTIELDAAPRIDPGRLVTRILGRAGAMSFAAVRDASIS